MVKDNKKGFGYYIGICEKGLPDRSTQKEIKRYLGQLFPEVYFTKNDIEEIRKELGKSRWVRLEKAKQNFRKKFPAGFDKYNVERYFRDAGFRLTMNERRSILKLKKKTFHAARLGNNELRFIELMSQITGLNKSMTTRVLVLLGMSSILSGTRLDILNRLDTALATPPTRTKFILSMITEPLIHALALKKLQDWNDGKVARATS